MRMFVLAILCSVCWGACREAQAEPNLSMESEEIDFGTVCWHGICEKTLSIRNAGDSPLHLKMGQYSCTCMLKPKLDDEVVSPGQSTKLHVEYRPNTLGASNGFVTIESDSASDPKKVLRLKARAVDEPAITPYAIELGPTILGEWRETSFTLKSKEPIDILEIASDVFQLDKESSKIEALPEGKRARIPVMLDENALAKNSAYIELKTTLKGTPRLRIPVSFKPMKPIECVPSSFYVMQEEASAGNWTRKGTLISHCGDLNLKNIAVSSPDVEVRIESSYAKRVDFVIRTSSSFRGGFKEIVVRFFFDRKDRPPVSCRVVVADL